MFARVYSALSARVCAFKTNVLAPDRRRNPWNRLACRLLGIALLAGVLGVGMLFYLVLVVINSIHRLVSGKPPMSLSQGRVMDGQYRVVDPKSDPSVMRKEF